MCAGGHDHTGLHVHWRLGGNIENSKAPQGIKVGPQSLLQILAIICKMKKQLLQLLAIICFFRLQLSKIFAIICFFRLQLSKISVIICIFFDNCL